MKKRRDWTCWYKKILGTNRFIVRFIDWFIYSFNRLLKINFNTRIAKTLKSLATKKQVKDALDEEDKNREKMVKLWTFDLRFLLVKATLMMIDDNIIWHINHF